MSEAVAVTPDSDRDVNPRRLVWAGLVIGCVGLLALGLSAIFSVTAMFHAYLVGYLFWLGVSLGSLLWLMIHHLAGGHWGWAMRRPMEGIASTLPWFIVGFLPVLLGLGYLYPWAAPHPGGLSEVLEHQRLWLNTPLILLRAVVYFAVWIGCMAIMLRPAARVGHAQPQAAIGLVLLFITITFAAVDWILAVEAKAFSSIWGLYVGVGFVVSAWGVLLWFAAWPLRKIPAGDLGKGRTLALRDLGNLLLVCVVMHAYMSFSQFFIIWNGNTQAEIVWYVPRERGAWGVLGVVLILAYFFLPFWALLFRFVKQRPGVLLSVASTLMAAQALSLMWMVLPGMNPYGHWGPAIGEMALSTLAIVGVGGVFMAATAWRWTKLEEPADRPRTALSREASS